MDGSRCRPHERARNRLSSLCPRFLCAKRAHNRTLFVTASVQILLQVHSRWDRGKVRIAWRQLRFSLFFWPPARRLVLPSLFHLFNQSVGGVKYRYLRASSRGRFFSKELPPRGVWHAPGARASAVARAPQWNVGWLISDVISPRRTPWHKPPHEVIAVDSNNAGCLSIRSFVSCRGCTSPLVDHPSWAQRSGAQHHHHESSLTRREARPAPPPAFIR